MVTRSTRLSVTGGKAESVSKVEPQPFLGASRPSSPASPSGPEASGAEQARVERVHATVQLLQLGQNLLDSFGAHLFDTPLGFAAHGSTSASFDKLRTGTVTLSEAPRLSLGALSPPWRIQRVEGSSAKFIP